MVTIILAVLGTICTIVSVYVAWRAHQVNMKDRSAEASTREITTHIDSALHPVLDKILLLEQRTGPDSLERARLQTLGMIREALDPVINVQTAMGVKVETLWNSLASSMAHILHQPDPARRHVDRLLEAFLDGTLTNEERLELRKYLVTIRDWEPGKESDFPIHPGEQAPAAILLLTMDTATPSPVHGGTPKK